MVGLQGEPLAFFVVEIFKLFWKLVYDSNDIKQNIINYRQESSVLENNQKLKFTVQYDLPKNWQDNQALSKHSSLYIYLRSFWK